ncbi:hypothetical protein TSOC_014402 [Tetrabaena socialis]|uniref:Uncharacterized protein n=1 Tax=Tetrabaena socialis TaxID=47790 RepID=A0A2J7ZHS1_9CHLO|nr:hypothetical protein TSOC_014402 [Tetrabaena socialis]|eukprot:PNG99807.1 hypothetical protein TSOC_014402 [Tetrabaena socialis]
MPNAEVLFLGNAASSEAAVRQLLVKAATTTSSSGDAERRQEVEAKTITVVLAPMLHSKKLMQFDRIVQGQRDLKELLKEVESVGLVPVGKKAPEDGDEEDGDEEDSARLMLSAEKLLRIPTLVTKFTELEDGAFYTVAASSKDVIRQIRQQIGHMLQAGEDQLGEATLAYAQEAEPGTVCSLAPGQRVFMEPDGRPSMEVDAVVIAGADKAYFASHKLRLTGPKPVEDIVEAVEKVKRLSRDARYSHTGYAEFGRFNKLVAVLGAEKVEPTAEVSIRDACRRNSVVFFKRNGRSFSVTSMSMHNVQRGHLGHTRAFGSL